MFTLICGECGAKVELEYNDHLDKIDISGTIDFSSEITITCKNEDCRHKIRVKG